MWRIAASRAAARRLEEPEGRHRHRLLATAASAEPMRDMAQELAQIVRPAILQIGEETRARISTNLALNAVSSM